MTTVIVQGKPLPPVVVQAEDGPEVSVALDRSPPMVAVTIADGAEVTTVRGGPQGPKGETGDYAPETFETISSNLPGRSAVLTWLDGDVVSIVYAGGVTKTLAYTDGDLGSVTLSGAVPDDISTVKTFTYSGGDLSGWSYS